MTRFGEVIRSVGLSLQSYFLYYPIIFVLCKLHHMGNIIYEQAQLILICCGFPASNIRSRIGCVIVALFRSPGRGTGSVVAQTSLN